MFNLFKRKKSEPEVVVPVATAAENFSCDGLKITTWDTLNDETAKELTSILTIAVALKLPQNVVLKNFYFSDLTKKFVDMMAAFDAEIQIDEVATQDDAEVETDVKIDVLNGEVANLQIGSVKIAKSDKYPLLLEINEPTLLEIAIILAFMMNKSRTLKLRMAREFDDEKFKYLLSMAKKCGYKIKSHSHPIGKNTKKVQTELKIFSAKTKLERVELKHGNWETKVFLLLCSVEISQKVVVYDELVEHNLLERTMCLLQVPVKTLDLYGSEDGVRKTEVEAAVMDKIEVRVDFATDYAKYVTKLDQRYLENFQI